MHICRKSFNVAPKGNMLAEKLLRAAFIMPCQGLLFVGQGMHALTDKILPTRTDHEELAAAENFNREMAELEALEHQEELRSLLQARISGEMRDERARRENQAERSSFLAPKSDAWHNNPL